jgi:prepilin-type N-terminal cleavage/methylation domain-containing protein
MSSLHKKSAFTLIELLVVISIILVASSIIFIGGNSGDGAKLSSSQRIVSGIAQGARGQAILKNAETRLIIYAGSDLNPSPGGEPDKWLRYFGIVYADPNDPNPANPTNWIAATQGTYLPEGIYFNKDLSDNNDWTVSTMNLEYPRATSQSEGGTDQYYYYKFNSNGTMATGFANAWLVLQAGTLRPVSGTLSVDFSEEDNTNLKSALIFRRVGTTTPVNDPIEIK